MLAEPAPHPSSTACPSTSDTEGSADNIATQSAAKTSSARSASAKSNNFLRKLFSRVRRKHRKGGNDGGVAEEKGYREACVDQGMLVGRRSSGSTASDEGKQRRRDGVAAAASAAPASAAASAAQSSEIISSSVEGGDRSTSGDTGEAEGARGGDTTPSSTGTRQGRGGDGLDARGGQGVRLENSRRSRDGRRIREGISVTAGGADAVWHRLTELLEEEEAGGGGIGGCSAEEEGGGRRRETAGQDLVHKVALEERREAVLQAVRWAWKVRVVLMLASLLRSTTVVQ